MPVCQGTAKEGVVSDEIRERRHWVRPVNCGKAFGFHSEDNEKPWYVFKQRHNMI